MVVFKKSGKEEEFSADKLAASLTYANQRTEEKIDIDFLISDLEKIVDGKEFITTSPIDTIMCGLLYRNGFVQTLVSYTSYDEKDKA